MARKVKVDVEDYLCSWRCDLGTCSEAETFFEVGNSRDKVIGINIFFVVCFKVSECTMRCLTPPYL
jgi:hypothetical protein